MSQSSKAIQRLSARETARQVAAGDLKVIQVAEAFLEAYAEKEGSVLAWKHLSADEVLGEAERLDKSGPTGALAGVTIGVKDVIDTVKMPTGYGASIYEGFHSYWDAPCVTLSRSADALILGKTVSTEFAMSHPGKTENPYKPGHTPGGSSSGSCAAVATGMTHLAFGTQTAGSIIRPSAYCGVTGYKPTFGTMDPSGAKVLAHSLDTLGFIGRDVRDVAYATAEIAGNPALQVADAPAKPIVGIFKTTRWAEAEPAAVDAMETAQKKLVDAGVRVKEIDIPASYERLFEVHHGTMGWETTKSLSYERLHHWESLGANTREFLTILGTATFEDYRKARIEILRQREKFLEMIDGFDVLLTPPAPGTAPEGLSVTGAPIFNIPWTTLHVPCLNLPVGLHDNGLPIGVQVVGRIGDDPRVLDAAAYIEAVLGFSDRLY